MCGLGIYLSAGCRFAQITHFGTMLKKTLGSLFLRKRRDSGVSPFQAMATALGGTIGTGNIVGVAAALAAGGPGAVFWMWCSALFGMMTKFAEVTLAVRYRVREGGRNRGGPMYYVTRGLGERYAPLAAAFAALCVAASFGVGNLAQVCAIADAARAAAGVPPAVCGIATAAAVMLVLAGGARSLTRFTGFFVPFMALFYLGGACAVIAANRANLPGAFAAIFEGAFGLRPALGGAAGYTLGRALRVGVARGVFTNEAGMGSAPIAHAAAETDEPAEQGLWGALEVFLDTIVVCTVTALAVLTSRGWLEGGLAGGGLTGAALTSAAFSERFGRAGPLFLAAATLCFAFASILAWAFYGQTCLEFLLRGRSRAAAVRVYRILFAAACAAGPLIGSQAVWNLCDVLNGLMAVPNVLALFLLSPEVFRLSRDYFSRIKREEKKSARRKSKKEFDPIVQNRSSRSG